MIGYGAATGLFSGFFGIGGGFLIVPGLMASTGMPMRNAVGSSLVAVTAFGLTAALNYALSGLVDWGLAAAFIAGGVIGGLEPRDGDFAATFVAGQYLALGSNSIIAEYTGNASFNSSSASPTMYTITLGAPSNVVLPAAGPDAVRLVRA